MKFVSIYTEEMCDAFISYVYMYHRVCGNVFRFGLPKTGELTQEIIYCCFLNRSISHWQMLKNGMSRKTWFAGRLKFSSKSFFYRTREAFISVAWQSKSFWVHNLYIKALSYFIKQLSKKTKRGNDDMNAVF